MVNENEHVIETVIVVEPPEPGTDEMVTLLTHAIGEAFNQLHQMFPFTSGDVMSACMHLLVEAGLSNASPAKLREDAIMALDGVLDENAKRRQKVN